MKSETIKIPASQVRVGDRVHLEFDVHSVQHKCQGVQLGINGGPIHIGDETEEITVSRPVAEPCPRGSRKP